MAKGEFPFLEVGTTYLVRRSFGDAAAGVRIRFLDARYIPRESRYDYLFETLEDPPRPLVLYDASPADLEVLRHLADHLEAVAPRS